MTTDSDPADQQRRIRRLRTLAERNGYRVHKNTLRTGHTAGKFMLTSKAGYGFIFSAMTLDQAERWVQTVPADDAGKLNHLLGQSGGPLRAFVCLDVDKIIDFYESGNNPEKVAGQLFSSTVSAGDRLEAEVPPREVREVLAEMLAHLDERIALAEQDNTDVITEIRNSVSDLLLG